MNSNCRARNVILGVIAVILCLSLSCGPQQGSDVTTTVTGILQIVEACDFECNRSETYYRLEEVDRPGRTFTLHIKGHAAGLTSGRRVTATGVAHDSELTLQEGGLTPAPGALLSPASVSGDQRTLIILCNLTDASTTASNGTLAPLIFSDSTSVNFFYQEASFNQVSFSGAIVGTYAISYSSSSTDYYGMASAADAAASAAGVAVSTYPRRGYVLPISPGWAGMATLGGNPSRVWIPNAYWSYKDVWAHEFGHNLGMNHASTPTSEYADTSCVMGYGGVGLRHFNAPHKVEMGWVPSAQIRQVDQGSYSVAMLETVTTSVQVLKIAQAGTTAYSYYVSYRRPVGFDATGLPGSYDDRISVHRWQGSGYKTYFLGAAADGQTVDTGGGVTVTQVSHDSTGATVTVTIGPPPPPPANDNFADALLLGGASGSQTGTTVWATKEAGEPNHAGNAGGSSIWYAWTAPASGSATITTAGSNFDTLLAVYTGGSVSALTLLAQNDDVGGGVTSAVTFAAVAGTSYKIAIDGWNGATGSTVLNWTGPSAVDSSPPAVSITSPAGGSTVSGTISVAMSATDNVGVTLVELYRDGVFVGSDSTSPYAVSWSTTTVANGSHSLVAKAYDAAGNVGTSSAVSVTVSNVTDSTGPATSITSPAGGDTVSGKIVIKVSATDPSGVSKVEFYVNGVLKNTDSIAAWEWSWNTKPYHGSDVTLTVKGFDTLGNSTTVSITVHVH